ncbi:MAG: rhodanese-like domain-containing protein [Chloroflexi bacterium]|uniref:rhodanese-like domain-containing protein n=1 Tax=Candidatus Flexifilum breve TaxID=3140694 RepID=UPI003135F741|nr:rhodanese-like domain-containing protein [Chloroflexota bacterium]
MKKLVLLLAILLLAFPTFFVAAQEAPVVASVEAFGSALPQGYGMISVDDFNVLLVEQELTLLDVREVAEYEAGHIEGSFNVPIRTVGQNLNLLPDLDAPIVVICKGGGRAMLAATGLNVLGYTNVKVLRGGFDAWAGEELPVTLDAFVPEAGSAPEIDAAVVAAVDNFFATLPEGYALVSPQNLAAELVENPPILIDVRTDEEWNSGYIEGAQHIPVAEFTARQSEWPADKDANIVIYCQSGVRGGLAMSLMRIMGYTNVRNMSGGVNGWLAAELPLVGVPFDLNTYIASYVAGLPETFNAVRVADLATELAAENDLLLVDVRTADEFAEGFIAGAINIPLGELTQHLDLLPNLDQPMVVYCGSGHRSAIAMTALNLLGYTNVRSMLSGFGGWTNAGNPVSTELTEAVAGTAPEFDVDVFAAVDAYMTSIPEGYWTVRAPDLAVELIENPPILIDVRTDGEWAAGWIEGAVHVSFADMFTLQAEWPQDLTASIVVYDNPTHRSSMTMTILRMLGYENVRVLAGGVGAWTNAGQALVTE